MTSAAAPRRRRGHVALGLPHPYPPSLILRRCGQRGSAGGPMTFSAADLTILRIRCSGCGQHTEKLVTSHLRLVAKIAMGYRGYGLPISEIASQGNVGLMQAVKRFEPEKGFRLATYAIWWIKASVAR